MTIEAMSADGTVHRFPDGTKQAVIDKVMKEYARRGGRDRGPRDVPIPPVDIQRMDTGELKQGAPGNVRAAVGSVPEEARLKALQQFFPDAAPIETPLGSNFVYSDPESGEGVLYNPGGVDVGDIPSVLSEIGEAAGGTLGGIGGAAVGGWPGAIGGAGAGAMVGREAIERGSMYLQDIEDPRTPFEQALDAGTTFAVNAFGQAVGGLAGQGIRAGTKGTLRGFAPRSATQQAISDLARFGEVPSWGGATDRPIIDTLESWLASVPGASGVIRSKAQQVSENIATSIHSKVRGLSGRSVTPFDAGKVVSEGVESFARNFHDRASALYAKVDNFIPSDTGTDVSRTRAILAELTNPVPGAKETSATLRNPALVKIAESIEADLKGSNSGALPWEVIKDMRSAIGRKLGTTSLNEDIPKAELKRVYEALTADMRIAAQQQGDEALRAFDRASQYYKAGVARIDKVLEPLIAEKTPARVFDAVTRAAKDGPKEIWALRNSVNEQQWRVIAGTIVERMGKGALGQQGVEAEKFSLTNFLRSYDSFRQAAGDKTLDALFSGPGMGSLRQDLDALARASERMRRSSQAYANPSGTARNLIGGTMAYYALSNLPYGNFMPALLMSGAALSAYGAGKLMTSPAFVRWLAQGTRVSPNGFGAHLGRLTAIAAASDADTRDAIEEFARNLSTMGQQ